MSNINNANWIKLDKEFEELIIDNMRFIRPIGSISTSLDCPICKKLIATVEDVESIKKENSCEECYLLHYYPNKEKWEKGWRPNNT